MDKHTVLLPIEVPVGKFCWERTGPPVICEHFSNEGGHSTCDLNTDFSYYLEDTDEGVLKAPKCAELKELK